MTHRLRVGSIFFLFVMTGCASHYGDAVNEFNQAVKSAKEVLDKDAQSLNEISRRLIIEPAFYPEEQTEVLAANPKLPGPAMVISPKYKKQLANFATSVCAGSDYLIGQKAAMATISVYDQTLQTINKKPKENISEVFNSIRKNWDEADALKPKDLHVPDDIRTICETEVMNLVTLEVGKVPHNPLLAGVAMVTLVQALIKATEKAILVTELAIDDNVRGRKLRNYIKESDATVRDALKKLDEGDDVTSQLCQELGNKPPCPPAGKKVTRLDGVTIAKKWGALRKPWHLFLSMASTRETYRLTVHEIDEAYEAVKAKALRDNKSAPPRPILDESPYWYTIDQKQEELRESLKDYLALRGSVGSGGLAKSLQVSHETLVSMANEKISGGEAWAILKDAADKIKTIADEAKNVQEKVKGYNEALSEK